VRKWAEIAGVAFDPKAVAEAVGDANVVAIGESTHGTHEFFEARGRLLEALIARGFNVLALEASYTNVLPLDGFVRRGEGTVDDVLMQIGQWTLNVAETREIVLALRAHNMNLPPSRQVAVVGLDFEPGGGDRNGTSERQKALTRFHERAMSSGDLHYVVREEAMADTLRWIRATSRVEPRVVLFAHNSHISRTGEGQMKTPLGSLVAELPGVRYFAVGMSFGEGEFRSTGPSGQRTFRVPAAPGGTIEHLFSSARGDAVVFRFDHDTPAWLTRRHPARHIGGMYGRESAEVYFEPPIAPAREYDAFLFFRTASASRPLGPTGSAGSLEGQPKAAAPANLDFDQPALQGWVSNPWSEKVGYRVHVSDNCASGSCASVIREVKSEGFAFGNVFQRFDAAPYRGQRVRFSAAVRIDPRAKDTRAQLWMRIDGKRSVLFLDNSDDNPIRSTAWVHEVGVTTLVPREADAIAVGMIVYGDGPAYLDSVRIEAVP
jgi:erythromycin esterase-like protein